MSKFKLLALAGLCSSLSISAYASSNAAADALATANAQIETWRSEADAITAQLGEETIAAAQKLQKAVKDSEAIGDMNKAILAATTGDYSLATEKDWEAAMLVVEAQKEYNEAVGGQDQGDALLAQYGQVTDRLTSIQATQALVLPQLEQALIAQNDKVQAYHTFLERDEILNQLKLQPKGLWLDTFQTHLSNSYTSSRNAVIALGYGHEFNPNVTAGAYVTKYYPHLSNKNSGIRTSYKNGYGVGLYALTDFGNYAGAAILDYKHVDRTENCLCNSHSQKSYGALLDLAYKGFANHYGLTPSIQYQYNRTTGGVTNFNAHQLGINLSSQFAVRPTTKIKASAGIAGVYATDPSSLYKMTTVDIRSYAGYLNQYATAGNTGFAQPYTFTTITASGKKKNEFDSKASVRVAVEHQFNEQTSLTAFAGYNAYFRSKLNGANYGIALNYRF